MPLKLPDGFAVSPHPPYVDDDGSNPEIAVHDTYEPLARSRIPTPDLSPVAIDRSSSPRDDQSLFKNYMAPKVDFKSQQGFITAKGKKAKKGNQAAKFSGDGDGDGDGAKKEEENGNNNGGDQGGDMGGDTGDAGGSKDSNEGNGEGGGGDAEDDYGFAVPKKKGFVSSLY